MDERIRQHLSECIQLWNAAESAAKQSELINRQVLEPCINELRYAGRWIILALSAIFAGKDRIDQFTTIDDAFAFAKLCCMQAKHDAVDSIVVFLHERIDDIAERYGHRIVAMFIPSYHEFLGKVEEIDSLIILSREKRENRHQFYDSILRIHIPDVQQFFKTVVAAEAAMNEELERERQQMAEDERRHREIVQRLESELAGSKADSKRNRTYFYITLGFAIFFGIASIAVGGLALPGIWDWLTQGKHVSTPLPPKPTGTGG
jgi:hypothetical protein